MPNINFKSREKDSYTLVWFELDGPITPQTLTALNPPTVNPTKGVVLSGRGPIWLYCYLAHHYHPTRFVATHDPRLGGAVIVESHVAEHRPGEVIKLEG